MAIKDNDPLSVMKELFVLITRVSKMYQVPNFDNTNAELLAEWVMDEYQHHDLELVLAALRKPPVLNDQAWRLTPDTLKAWIDLKRIEREEKRLAKESEQRQVQEVAPPVLPDHVNALIEKYKQDLKEGIKPVAPITPAEIKQEGQHRPKKPAYTPPKSDYYTEWQARMREFQYRTVKERHPELSEEEVKRIIDNLPL